MNARELRTKFIEFFQTKEHLLHPSAPLVPIDVTGKLDETLLFTGAGMVQFKPYFRGLAKPPHPRLVDSQKCVRAVDIEEVGNPSHLTFFEMLGNFSFGDYFKQEAITWAWEFLTSSDWLGLEPQKLCVTVFTDDDEAYSAWESIWSSVGFDPSKRIHRLGEDKNYWPAGAFSNGPPGPCGPCSEIFYQMVPDSQLTGDFIRDDEAGRWLEIWNLVFMQYEWKGELKDQSKPHLGFVKHGIEPLPAKCIDTGSGLERTAAAIEGLTDVYQTDVFLPIVERICAMSGAKYYEETDKTRAIRIISDHMRTACFCIADGILPSNTGRGYVLRRLIRRSVLKGQRVLGFEKPFLENVFPAVVEALGDPYFELNERSEVIRTTLRNEEEAFRRTLAEGMERFAIALEKTGASNQFPGDEAFFLYDTYGFPLEVTKELAAEHHMTVDLEKYEECLREAQERSRAAQGPQDVFGGADEAIVLTVSPNAKAYTEFVGYQTTKEDAVIVQISPRFDKQGLSTGDFQVCLDKTPFYPESGGQVGDTGRIFNDEFMFEVVDTWKELGLIWHDCKLVKFGTAPAPFIGLTPEKIAQYLDTGMLSKPVRAEVDVQRRKNITRNHTGTHLLHAALRNVLGKHVTQAGSLVAPDRLRFDFTHGEAMKSSEIDLVERAVNERIAEAIPVVAFEDVPIDEARKRGAMMLFGEKYGDRVRMIEIGDYSLELCGGIHVQNSAEIGMFKIVGESSSASGVRRIEAVTGLGAYEWAKGEERILEESAKKLKSSPSELPRALDRLQEQLRELKRERDRLLSGSADQRSAETKSVGPFLLKTQIVSIGGQDAAKLAADRLVENDDNAVAVVALKDDGKVMFFCKVGKAALKNGAHAGNIVREVAKVAGGGGGGSPQFAQAGAKDASKIEDALKAAHDLLLSAQADKFG